MLEQCAVKVASTVLRRVTGGNASGLSEIYSFRRITYQPIRNNPSVGAVDEIIAFQLNKCAIKPTSLVKKKKLNPIKIRTNNLVLRFMLRRLFGINANAINAIEIAAMG